MTLLLPQSAAWADTEPLAGQKVSDDHLLGLDFEAGFAERCRLVANSNLSKT